MPRTTAKGVKKIITTNLSYPDIDAFIAGANALVTDVLGSDTTLTASMKAEIERWLAAHMIASTRQQQLKSGEAGSAKAEFQGKWGLGLDGTSYGQMVKTLDTTGSFAALGGKAVSTIAIESFD